MNKHFLFSLSHGDSVIRAEAGEGDGTADDGDTSDDADENQDDESPEDDDEAPGEDDEELDEEERKEASKIYKLLKDPSEREGVLEVLAKRSGFKLEKAIKEAVASDETPADAADDIAATLKKALGKDYEWLADKLAPAIKQVVEKERKQTQKVLGEHEQRRIDTEVVQVTAKLNRESNGLFGRLQEKINALADEMLPSPGMSTEKYMRNLFMIAAGGKSTNSEKRTLAEKIRRNSNDPSIRMASQRGSAGGGTVKGPPATATMDEIIDFEAVKLKAGTGKRK